MLFRSEANPGGDERYQTLLDERDACEARHQANRALEASLTRAGVPSRVLAVAMAPRPEGPVVLAREWLQSGKPWLVLLGSTGVGKSVAAGVACVEAAQAGASVLWLPAAELATRAGGFDGQTFALRCKGVGLLVVDDFGTEHASDFARSVMLEVLMHRHENGERTVVTSNLAGVDFAKRIGSRMADRMRNAGRSKEFAGPSLRGAA